MGFKFEKENSLKEQALYYYALSWLNFDNNDDSNRLRVALNNILFFQADPVVQSHIRTELDSNKRRCSNSF